MRIAKILKYKIKTLSFLYFFLLSLFLTAQTNYYVSAENGSDSNNGTSQVTPFLTINKGISMVSPGGTVYVMDGTYRNANFNTNKQLGINPSNLTNGAAVNFNKSGEAGNPITLRNLQGHAPKIEFDGAGGINVASGSNYIIIEGFEIVGPSQYITYPQANADRLYKIAVAEDGDINTNYSNNYFSGHGIYGYSPRNNVIVRNNVVHDTPGSGIRLNDSDHVTIEYNTVYNTTWWTSSASSAIVLAETISSDIVNDNGTDIKMIIRSNIVYNNWNRIIFYKTQEPDNSGNPNPEYGTATFKQIWDGQGIYVTRSDPGYKGTFLFENNLCVNNGKNGINFDHSKGASAIYRNNTLYFNGVHEIIQDISVSEGNTAHRGQKVAGIKSNDMVNATVVNNIVVTRDNQFSALELVNVSGVKTVNNNIFRNGTVPDNLKTGNLIDIDPLFVSVPTTVYGAINMAGTDFSLMENSPAIDAGDKTNSPVLDINGELRPVTPTSNPDEIVVSDFEEKIGAWVSFGNANLTLSTDQFKSGSKSLFVSNRQYNYSAPKLALDGLLTVGETYTFSVWVKLVAGVSGTSQITIKKQINGIVSYIDLTTAVTASDGSWTQLTADYTYDVAVGNYVDDYIFVYIKGPSTATIAEGKHYYIDNFSLLKKGTTPIDFDAHVNNNPVDIVDIGAYEYKSTLSIDSTELLGVESSFILYPNPATNFIYLEGASSANDIAIYDLLGGKQLLLEAPQFREKKIILNISHLATGLYFVKINQEDTSISTKRFIKK
ncbi:MAG: hypothetical protein ABS28_02935 [Cryomorphaceae bacterium BACL22 MAG-120619-bin32]|jgi:parallel beta-helix repeat protein|nr:MAG: hypothetical protein ABS28_02935 [Cryomorphaceae bacterium BACL22 MAG-120619-bin32]